MAARVQLLGDALIDQIAAGEVIERPASVVKELVDNALDAGSMTIRVELKDGGRERILVQDDGEGMDREDASMSVVRHATSKLRELGDLNAIATLGFRGEALASIASVCKFRLLTRRRDDIEGTEIRIEGGGAMNIAPIGAAPGTTVDVQELFYNVPARRKFLSARQTEMKHVARVCLHAALGNPQLRLTLMHDGRKLREFLPVRSRQERVQATFSDFVMASSRGEKGGIRVEAITAPAANATRGARKLHLIVNGRPVVDRRLAYSVAFAFGDEIPSGHYPVGVVYIDLDPEGVDVNAHPQKTEVRFASPQSVSDAVTTVVGRTRSTNASLTNASPASATPALPRSKNFWNERLGGGTRAGERSVGYGAPSPASELAAVLREGAQEPPPLNDEVPPIAPAHKVGTLHGGEWIVERESVLYIIDPTRLDAALAAQAMATPRGASLLFPARLELDAKSSAALEDARESLEALGFAWSHLGGSTFVVDAVPHAFAGVDGGELLCAALEGGRRALLRLAPPKSEEERLAAFEDEDARKGALHRVDLRTLRGLR